MSCGYALKASKVGCDLFGVSSVLNEERVVLSNFLGNACFKIGA